MPPKGGRPKNKDAANSKTQDAVLEQELEWLKGVMGNAQTEGKEYYGTLTQESFDKLRRNKDSLVPVHWSSEDEEQVQSQWDRECVKRPCKEATSYEQYMWKTCARFLRCLPTELIGMRYGLEYNADQASQNWTASFCNHLIKIIAHPIFDNNPAKIALAIKFSVCSWQRLKWVIPDLNDLFLQVLREVAEDSDEMVGAELVRDSIKEWRVRWPGGGLPPWAQLLRAIVANCKRPISSAQFPHRVATEHVNAIVASLNETKHGQMPLYHSADLSDRVLRDIRATTDLPKHYKDPVHELLAEGIIHNRRLQMLSERYPDVNDLYEHVSQPEAPLQAPEDEYKYIFDEPAQPETSNKSRPGRPKKNKPVLANTLGGEAPAASSDIAPGATAAKKQRGRPRKGVKPAETDPEEMVEEASTNLDTGTADAAGLGDADSANTSVPVVLKRLRRGRRNRVLDSSGSEHSDSAPQPNAEVDESEHDLPRAKPSNAATGTDRSPLGPPKDDEGIFDDVMPNDDLFLSGQKKTSVPESIASLGERQAEAQSQGLAFGETGAGSDDGFNFDVEEDIENDDSFRASPFSRQQSLDNSPSKSRPATSHSQDLGQESLADDEVADEKAIDEANSASADDEMSESDDDIVPADTGVSIRMEEEQADHSDSVDQGKDRIQPDFDTLHTVSDAHAAAQEDTAWDPLP